MLNAEAIRRQIPLLIVIVGIVLLVCSDQIKWATDAGLFISICFSAAVIGAGLGAVYPRPIRSAFIGALLGAILMFGFLLSQLSMLSGP